MSARKIYLGYDFLELIWPAALFHLIQLKIEYFAHTLNIELNWLHKIRCGREKKKKRNAPQPRTTKRDMNDSITSYFYMFMDLDTLHAITTKTTTALTSGKRSHCLHWIKNLPNNNNCFNYVMPKSGQ